MTERFDIEEQDQYGNRADRMRGLFLRAATAETSRGTSSISTIAGQPAADKCPQFVPLRKYSVAICLIEALAIVLLIYLLLKLPPSPESDTFTTRDLYARNLVLNSGPYRVYTDHLNSARLLLGLAPNCTQRKHDLAHSVQCRSSQAIGECALHFDQNSGPKVVRNSVELIETTKSGLRLAHRREKVAARILPSRELTATHPRGGCSMEDQATTRVIVRRNVRHQEIIGWGGALTDSTIQNILSLTTNGTRNLLDDYFGLEGLRFNMVRVTIGGSDMSSRFYTNDDLETAPLSLNNNATQTNNNNNNNNSNSNSNSTAATSDFSLTKFKLMDEDRLYKIPLLKTIQSDYFGTDELRQVRRSSLKVFASMWSPPVWLKTNGHFNKGQLRANKLVVDQTVESFLGPLLEECCNGTTEEENILDLQEEQLDKKKPSEERETFLPAYKALAELKRKFLRAYLNEGVRMWALTVMNEPIFAVQPFLNFNTMIFPPNDYKNYIVNYLGPTLRNDADLTHLKLMIHDDNRRFLDTFTRPLLERHLLRHFIDGVSVHGYIDEEYEQMTKLYEDFGQDQLAPQRERLFILPTELCSGHLPFMDKALVGNWHRGMHYALDIVRSLQARAAGWVDWNMALDLTGGPGWLGGRLDAPILVDKLADLYHKSPMFYVLGQFSRYIPPGARQLELKLSNSQYDNQLEMVAFEAPAGNQMILVVVNNNPYPININWRLAVESTEVKSPDECDDGEFFLTQSPADSVQTIIYNF